MSQSNWKIGRYRGKLALVYHDAAGVRRRYTLGTADPREAERRAPIVFAELSRPVGGAIRELWKAFRNAYEDRAIHKTLGYTWRALEPVFGELDAGDVRDAHSEVHIAARRAAGIGDGTIHTELGHLRMVLAWAVKSRLIGDAPQIWCPKKPDPVAFYLSRRETRAFIDACKAFHVRLFTVLALGTAGRRDALLGLTWDRIDFARGLINLKDPAITRPHKGRAIVPMNDAVRAALVEARAGAISRFVIEVGGERIGSLKRGLAAAAVRAGLPHVSHHDLRHVAASHMAEAGVPMEEIAQILGHSNVNTTRRLYARFSPTYLRAATAALDYRGDGDAAASDSTPAAAPATSATEVNPATGSPEPQGTMSFTENANEFKGLMVGVTGIEPVTPTMST